MSTLWHDMVLWQRLALGAMAAAVVLGGGLVWASRTGGKASGDVASGAVCAAGSLTEQVAAGEPTPKTADVAGVSTSPMPSGTTELATFALG